MHVIPFGKTPAGKQLSASEIQACAKASALPFEHVLLYWRNTSQKTMKILTSCPMTSPFQINKQFRFFIWAWLLVLPLWLPSQNFPPKPSPARLVNDFAGLLSQDQVQQLESKLVAFDDSTSTQIAVVIMQETGGYPASQFAPELLHKWGIGQKGKDNGILIFVNLSEREMFIATGYGIEEFVTDARAGDVIEQDLRPYFRNEKYYEGLDAATTHLMEMVKGTFKAEKRSKKPGKGLSLIFLVLIIIAVIILSKLKGGGGGFYRTFGGPGGGGYFPGHFGRGGGGFGGFGGSGGGFGGFGGGGGGGGGAGGRW